MDSPVIARLILGSRERIAANMRARLAALSWSPYQEFILRNPRGVHRLPAFIGLIGRALLGEERTFFTDQEQQGYARAVQNFTVDFGFDIYWAFREAVADLLREDGTVERLPPRLLHEELHALHGVLAEGRAVIARSFLRKREEIISERVAQLRQLRDFSRDLIRTRKAEEVVRLLFARVRSLFLADGSHLFLGDACRTPEGGDGSGPPPSAEVLLFVREALRVGTPFLVAPDGTVSPSAEGADFRRLVAVPFRGAEGFGGAFALYASFGAFPFDSRDLKVLQQVVHMAAMAVENALAVGEIERNREELRFLAGKMIGIQEEERRRLARDIHDTLAQTLAGIGYKLQYCAEVARSSPKVVPEKLAGLREAIARAVGQCRELISSLRPDLLDSMGLGVALGRFFEGYAAETGIRVESSVGDMTGLPPETRICVFRVVQEALANVARHAGVDKAAVTLFRDCETLRLVVEDRGRGFDPSRGAGGSARERGTLGLLSMKERVEALDGGLCVSSRPGEGCRVEAVIPIPEKACDP